MTTKKRTEVFIETKETYIIRQKRVFVRIWCEECQSKVSMISPSTAALFACLDLEIIYSLIDTKQLHSCYLKSETPLVCLKSLFLI
jgi:hypothetical protein